MSVLSSTSTSFGTAAASTRFENNSDGIDDAIKAQALAEEEAMMNQFKVSEDPLKYNYLCIYRGFSDLQQSKVSSPGGINPSTNPFLASPPTASAAPIVDLFDAPVQEARSSDFGRPAPAKTSDDLLQLGNPFADMFGSAPAAAPVAAAPPNQMWMGNGGGMGEGKDRMWN